MLPPRPTLSKQTLGWGLPPACRPSSLDTSPQKPPFEGPGGRPVLHTRMCCAELVVQGGMSTAKGKLGALYLHFQHCSCLIFHQHLLFSAPGLHQATDTRALCPPTCPVSACRCSSRGENVAGHPPGCGVPSCTTRCSVQGAGRCTFFCPWVSGTWHIPAPPGGTGRALGSPFRNPLKL